MQCPLLKEECDGCRYNICTDLAARSEVCGNPGADCADCKYHICDAPETDPDPVFPAGPCKDDCSRCGDADQCGPKDKASTGRAFNMETLLADAMGHIHGSKPDVIYICYRVGFAIGLWNNDDRYCRWSDVIGFTENPDKKVGLSQIVQAAIEWGYKIKRIVPA
jgi:hypothetical protein